MLEPCKNNSLTNITQLRKLAIIVLLLSFPSLTPLAQTQQAQKYALVIGIKGYPHFEESKRLKFADNDAIQFADFIKTPEGGSFPVENIQLLTNEGADRTRINRAINWLASRTTNRDLVYVFFAGHGVLDSVGKAYLMPYDGDPTEPENLGFVAGEFLARFRDRINAKHMIFFIDACHAGSGINTDSSARDSGDNITGAFKNLWAQAFQGRESAMIGFFSATSNQKSWEDPTLQQGLFSYYLIEGLKGAADRNRDGKVLAAEAYRYLLDNVEERSHKQFALQTPIISPSFEPDFPLAFTRSSNRSVLIMQDRLKGAALEPPFAKRIRMTPSLSQNEVDVANNWNRQGGLFEAIAETLEIDPVAALVVYSSLTKDRPAFGPDGRVAVRFNPALFWRYWGKDHPKEFAVYFNFDMTGIPGMSRSDFRASASDEWHSLFRNDHYLQWQAFALAQSLDEEAAVKSVQMGPFLVLGANHDLIGYRTGREMLNSFRSDIRYQILGFFDFLKNTKGTIDAIRAKDFRQLLKIVNRAVFLSELQQIESRYSTLKSLMDRRGELPTEANGELAFPSTKTLRIVQGRSS